MARIRSIKPEFFRSRKLAECSPRARLTFIGLWTLADDEGRYQYEPELLKADLWPWEPDIGPKEADACVVELVDRGRLCLYEHGGKTYLHVVTWEEHQKISHKSESRLPACPREIHGRPPEGSGGFRSVQEDSGEHQSDTGGLRPDLGSGSRKGIRDLGDPSGRSATAENITTIPTAQGFVAAYVNAYRGRAGHDPPSRVKGQVAKHVGEAFREGIAAEHIRDGLREWFEANQHPATIPSFIEVAGRGGRPRTRQQANQDQQVRTSQAMAAWASEEGGEHGPDRLGVHGGPPARGLPAPAD